MFLRMTIGCGLAMVFVVAVGCSRGPSRLLAPPINASSSGTKAIAQYDADKDGKLSGAELDKCPALKAALAQIDTAGDGTITAAKITARIQAWQESKAGRLPVNCTVLRNGQPLSGAEVKFMPEKFLGDNLPTASGKTNQNGMAIISVADVGPGQPRGVPPGLYRVEITKPGDNIPSKFNTDTTLGQEVALGAKGMQEGMVFNLAY